MHEISLLESVLDTLETQAEQQGFQQVKQVVLEIGALSCVEADALRFGFEAVMKNSLAEHAELVIIKVSGQGVCPKCQQTVLLETRHDPCHHCGSFGVTVLQGQSMRIKELIVI
ncbi:MAG: hydrogenase maturation nickel metallochaperone HypA [Methylococcales bacterium]|nr:hydrogenase maturation nickel metallochaperone HypA [Methylococcales bacterium]